MKDTRLAEIAWMIVIAVLLAFGGTVLLAMLAEHRAFAAVLLGALVVAAAFGVRRALARSARSEITKAAAYLVAALFAFVAIALHVHWAIGACVAAAEVAIVFDIVSIAARPRTVPGD